MGTQEKEFDLNAFLGGLELEDAEREVVQKALSKEKNRTELSQGYKRQSDYSRDKDGLRAERESLAAQQKDIKAKEDSLTALIADNKNYKTKADKVLKDERVAREKAELKALKAAQLAGYDVDEIEVDDETPKKPKQPAFDPTELDEKYDKKYVTADNFNRVAAGSFELMLTLPEIMLEHQELFGKPIKKTQIREIIKEWQADTEEAARKGVEPPRIDQSAERVLKFKERRDELGKEAIDAEVERKFKEREAEWLKQRSEDQLPHPRRESVEAPFFRNSKDTKDPQRGVKAALAATQTAQK